MSEHEPDPFVSCRLCNNFVFRSMAKENVCFDCCIFLWNHKEILKTKFGIELNWISSELWTEEKIYKNFLFMVECSKIV